MSDRTPLFVFQTDLDKRHTSSDRPPRFDPVDASAVWEDEDIAYVPMEHGPLVALGPQTGESNWSHEATSGSGVSGSPALADGQHYVGNLDGTFHAIDTVTGDVLWPVESMENGSAARS